MKREILINAAQRETRVAILEDDQLVELMIDRPDNRRMVGDIYLGKVEAVLPGIQAAFVQIGTEKSAFLHASDLVFDDGDDDDDEDDVADVLDVHEDEDRGSGVYAGLDDDDIEYDDEGDPTAPGVNGATPKADRPKS